MLENFSWGDFWAAFFGALAAFLLGVLAKWVERNTARQDAANRAVMALAQMYSQLKNAKAGCFDEQAKEFRERTTRAIAPWNYRPIAGIGAHQITLDIKELSFLSMSHDTNLPNRMLQAELDFRTNIDQLKLLQQIQLDFQRRAAGHLSEQRVNTREDVVGAVGPDVVGHLESMVRDMPGVLEETYRSIHQLGIELSEAASLMLPLRRIHRFVDKNDPAAADAAAIEVPKSRRFIRDAMKRVRSRKKIKLNT